MPFDLNTASELTPRHLLILREVARTQSVREAAEALHLTEVTVRQNLAALERAIGGGKLKRQGKRYRLSELGELVLEHASEIIEKYEALTQIGKLRPPAVAFLPHHSLLLARVCETHPDPIGLMTMEVLGESERSEVAYRERVLGRLAAGGIDVAVGHPAGIPSLNSQPLYRASYCALLPANNAPKTIKLSELAESRLLLPPAATRSRALLDRGFVHEGLAVDIALEAYQTKVLILMGWAGLGIVVLPSDLARLYAAQEPFGGHKASDFKWVTVVDGARKPLQHIVNVTTRYDDTVDGLDEIIAALQTAATDLDYDTHGLDESIDSE